MKVRSLTRRVILLDAEAKLFYIDR